jgi:hypothetical protein
MSVKNTKPSLFPVRDLSTTFRERETAFSNRSSCIFPAFLSENADTHLVFLNYWTLKNKIELKNITFNVRIRDSLGVLMKKATLTKIESHNQVSVRNILEMENNPLNFEFRGTVELELISIDNLRYSFPAVTVIYQSGNLFSAVHSAGRIKNSDESQALGSSDETNWNCKFGDNVTPFFHYFVGPSLPKYPNIEVTLRNKLGNEVDVKIINISHLSPFASQVYFIDQLFDCSQLDSSYFISVKVEHNSVYPRMVVGNYFKEMRFFEVTHSYPILEVLDYCPVTSEDTFQSIISAFSSDKLGLSLRSFPTFNRPDMDLEIYEQVSASEQLLKSNRFISEEIIYFMNGQGSYTLGDQEKFIAFCLKGNKVPARMTISYQFYVKGVESHYSTDISDGAKACIFPPKYNFWGHGVLHEDFETCIFLRNKSFSPNNTKTSKGQLRIFAEGINEIFNVEIKPETLKILKINDFLNRVNTKSKGEVQFLSWILSMDQPSCDLFWISYSPTSGNVFGDHGF